VRYSKKDKLLEYDKQEQGGKYLKMITSVKQTVVVVVVVVVGISITFEQLPHTQTCRTCDEPRRWQGR